MNQFHQRLMFIAIMVWSFSATVIAGVLFEPAVKWTIFAFEPIEEEDTPNYQGITGEVKVGYSFRQVFDVAGFANYSGGNPGLFKVPGENANFVAYGGELAARIYQAVYFGIRGGTGSYQLLSLGKHPDEVPGLWSGPAYGFSLGAISPMEKSKRGFLQFSFDFMQVMVTEQDAADGGSGERKIDSFSISFAYVFNGYHNAAIENSFFSSYLDSFIFWE